MNRTVDRRVVPAGVARPPLPAHIRVYGCRTLDTSGAGWSYSRMKNTRTTTPATTIADYQIGQDTSTNLHHLIRRDTGKASCNSRFRIWNAQDMQTLTPDRLDPPTYDRTTGTFSHHTTCCELSGHYVLNADPDQIAMVLECSNCDKKWRAVRRAATVAA